MAGRRPRCVDIIGISCLALFLFMVSTQGYRFHKDIPGNYVLEVFVNCTPTPTGYFEVQILTDLNLAVHIKCKDNYTEELFTFDSINFYFEVGFSGDSSLWCIFDKKENSNTYTMLVETEWGEPETEIRPVVEPYLITCAYDENMDNISNVQPIGKSLIAPQEIQTHQGTKTASNIDLDIVDIRGDVFTDEIHRGRVVYLLATSDGAGGEAGLRAVSCFVTGNSGTNYQVLRAGCGDGLIFDQDHGFITEGLQVKSPYFNTFNLKDSSSIKFHCNFTMCTQSCNGSSCASENRRRRSNDEMHAACTGSMAMTTDTTEASEVRTEHMKEETLNPEKSAEVNEKRWKTPLLLLGVAGSFSVIVGVVLATLACRRNRSSLILPTDQSYLYGTPFIDPM